MEDFPKPNGIFVKTDKRLDSFVPNLLPPELDLTKLMVYANEASHLIGTLNGFGRHLQNPHLLIRPQLMKEAVQSSKIEGSQVSLSDLYRYEIGIRDKQDGVMDSEEVSNYVDALEVSLEKVGDGAVLNLELINECHKILLRGVRGNYTNIGKLREQQNFIGRTSRIEEARYIPPVPSKVPELMENLISFMDSPPHNISPLLQ